MCYSIQTQTFSPTKHTLSTETYEAGCRPEYARPCTLLLSAVLDLTEESEGLLCRWLSWWITRSNGYSGVVIPARGKSRRTKVLVFLGVAISLMLVEQ